MISADICGEADGGGLARQWWEFKTYRKSTAQLMYHAKGGVLIGDPLSGRNPLVIKVILAAGGVQPQ